MAETGRTVEQIREEIASADMSRDELLSEMRRMLGATRVALPNIWAIQEAERHQAMRENLEAAELMYGEYIGDKDGVFRLAELQETLALIRFQHQTITDVMDRYIRGE